MPPLSQSLRDSVLSWLASLAPRSIAGFRELGKKFCHNFVAQRETIPASDHSLTIRQQPQETVQACTKRLKVLILHDREHIQAYKHGLRSFSLTKMLATKRIPSIDDLLDIVHKFIKGEISVQSKQALI